MSVAGGRCRRAVGRSIRITTCLATSIHPPSINRSIDAAGAQGRSYKKDAHTPHLAFVLWAMLRAFFLRKGGGRRRRVHPAFHDVPWRFRLTFRCCDSINANAKEEINRSHCVGRRRSRWMDALGLLVDRSMARLLERGWPQGPGEADEGQRIADGLGRLRPRVCARFPHALMQLIDHPCIHQHAHTQGRARVAGWGQRRPASSSLASRRLSGGRSAIDG